MTKPAFTTSLLTLLGRLFAPGIFAGVLLTAILSVATYQVRPTYAVPIGGPTDLLLVRGFNSPEALPGTPPQPFRWSKEDSYITFRDAGRQDFNVTLTASGYRPAGAPPPHMTIDAGGATLVDVVPAPQPTNYTFSVPSDAVKDGTLLIHLHTSTFVPQNDPNPRTLGVMVLGVLVEPGANTDSYIEPPARVVVGLVAASALLGALAALLGWGWIAVAIGACLPGLFGSWLLVADRMWLTSGRWYEAWLEALLVGAVFAGLAAAGGALLCRLTRRQWPIMERRLLLTILLLTFAVRLAGQLHPLISIVDLSFHAHRFDTVQSGQWLFTIKSAEWGGHDTFYLPTAYIFMLPLQRLLNDEFLVIKLLTVACGTVGAALVYVIARRVLQSGEAGIIAALLYVVMPISILPYSWGITTNIFGECFALAAFAVLVTNYKQLRPTALPFWAFLGCLLLALLSHPGVVQLAGLAFGLIALLWLFVRRYRDIEVRRAWLAGAWAMLALALAAVLSYGVYYVHFAADMLNTLGQIRAERAAQAKVRGLHLLVGGSVSDKGLGLIVQYVENRRDWLVLGLRGFWNEASAYYKVWPLAASALGFLTIWPARYANSRQADGRRKLALAALGWAGAVLIYAVIGWTVNLYVRYSLFALPVVALGGAALLARLSARSRSGAVLVCLLLAFFAFNMLSLWHDRISYAFK